MPRFTSEPAFPPLGEANCRTEQTCYYWLCAGIMLEAYDIRDRSAFGRVQSAMACSQSSECVRAQDCRELSLAALARLLQERSRG